MISDNNFQPIIPEPSRKETIETTGNSNKAFKLTKNTNNSKK